MFENEHQKLMTTFKENQNDQRDRLFSIGALGFAATKNGVQNLNPGLIANDYFETIDFKIFLRNSSWDSSLVGTEQTNNVKIYEIGSSYLNIQDIQEINEGQIIYNVKRISLNETIDEIKDEKEIVLLFVYNELLSGRSIIKPYSIKLYTKTTSDNIVSLEIHCSKEHLYFNDELTYSIKGITLQNDSVDITDILDEDSVTLISPEVAGTATINTSSHTLVTNESIITAGGYIKVEYKDLIEHKYIYFEAKPK